MNVNKKIVHERKIKHVFVHKNNLQHSMAVRFSVPVDHAREVIYHSTEITGCLKDQINIIYGCN